MNSTLVPLKKRKHSTESGYDTEGRPTLNQLSLPHYLQLIGPKFPFSALEKANKISQQKS